MSAFNNPKAYRIVPSSITSLGTVASQFAIFPQAVEILLLDYDADNARGCRSPIGYPYL